MKKLFDIKIKIFNKQIREKDRRLSKAKNNMKKDKGIGNFLL